MSYNRYPPLSSGGGGGSGTVTQVNTSGGLTGGPITTTGTVSIADTAVTPAAYGDSTHVGQFTVDQKGRITAAANVAIVAGAGTVTSVALTTPAAFSVSGSPVTSSGTLAVSYSGTAIPASSGGTGVTSLGNLTDAGTDGIVVTGGTGATVTNVSLAQHVADSTHNGYLSSTDWSTFNGKGTGTITALTGDVTASGTGSVAATVAVGAVTDTKGSLSNKPALAVVATTNQTLSGTPTIDGQATTAGMFVLLSAQTAGAENGPWTVQAGAWTRPTWYPSGGTTQAFQFITSFIRLGTVYQGSTWRMTTSGAITIDTTATTWVVTPVAFNTSTSTSTMTGTGSVVFSTSPTLVTPILGTPTSGTLTNATGLPLTTGVTGTLPVGNGGTGLATITSNKLIKGAGGSAAVVTGINVGSNDELSLYLADFDDQVGTTYTLASTDRGMVITMTNASPITLTLPNSLLKGFTCLVYQGGAGVVTFTAGAGSTLRSRQSFTKTAGQYAVCSLVVVSNAGGSSAVFVLGGDGSV